MYHVEVICHCILEIDHMKIISAEDNLPSESVTFDNLDESIKVPTHENMNINWENSSVNEANKMKIPKVVNDSKSVISDVLEFTHITSHIIHTENNPQNADY